MRWKQGRRSDNVEDMRSSSSPSMAMGGASAIGRILPLLLRTKTGRGFLLIAVVVYFGAKFMGYDLLQLAAPPGATSLSNGQQLSPQDQELADFVSVVLADTESTWHLEFK